MSHCKDRAKVSHQSGFQASTRRNFLGTAALGLGGVTVILLASLWGAEAATPFVVPLDSVPHKRTWMAWPSSKAIWGPKLAGIQSDIALIAKTIAKYEPVVMCANANAAALARNLCGPTVTVITSIPVDDCWMRDSGPIFRVDGNGGVNAVGLNFNGWGNKQIHSRDALVAARVAAYAGVPFTTAGFVSEGGAIETDGDGTLLATESSIINSNRNPGKTKEQLEVAMFAAYGNSKVIWFPGLRGKDITDDHVDATSRFVAPGSALVQVPHPGDTDIWSLDELRQFQILSGATDAKGRSIAVAPIQGPDYTKTRQHGINFVGSYANYYVCNGAVISQNTGDPSTDASSLATLAAAFPGRVIEQLIYDNIANGGGGVHCVTQPEPLP